ncbi:hypothetical protein GCM10010517_51260 [Streptosporangium fragile]|uniref:Uncharacterized protein n=1 Tax=Streptosporangium fragile TaxID=46186 RepID=A0ABN3W252_9ACTN
MFPERFPRVSRVKAVAFRTGPVPPAGVRAGGSRTGGLPGGSFRWAAPGRAVRPAKPYGRR